MNSKKQEVENESTKNQEERLNQLKLNAFVYTESAYRNQLNFGNGKLEIPRCSEANPLTIDEILQLICPQLVGKYTGNGYIYKAINDQVTATPVNNKEELMNINPFKLLAEDFDANYTLTIEYKGVDEKCYFIHLYLRGLVKFDSQWYARISVMKSHEGKDDLRSGNTDSHPEILSFLIVNDLEGAEKALDEFDAIDISANQSLEEQKPIKDAEMEVLNGRLELYNPFYYFEYGKALFAQEHYYDAYTQLLRAYNILKTHFYFSDNNEKGVFFGVCYHLGQCLVQMQSYARACYFLGIAHFGTGHHEAEYANALALSGHERVVFFINKLKDGEDKEKNEAKIEELRKTYKLAGKEAAKDDTFETGSITLGMVLNEIFDVCQRNLTRATIEDTSKEAKASTLTDSAAIWNLDLMTMNNVVINLAYNRLGDGVTDKSLLNANNTIIVSIDPVNAENKQMKRVNVMIPNFAFDDHKQHYTPINTPHCCSFILADAPEKKTFSKDQLFDLLNEAVAIGNEGRIFESLAGMKFIHNHLKEAYMKADATDEIEELFYVSTFRLGCCYNQLRLLEKGYYCLDWSNESQIDVNIHEFVNCLCDMNDVRALYFIDRYIKTTKAPEDQQFMERFNKHMAFLKQRKAILLLENQLYKDAEDTLKEMVDDPLTKEFANTHLEQLNAFMKQREAAIAAEKK